MSANDDIEAGLSDALTWMRLLVSGHPGRAFAAEAHLWFFSGFVTERCLTRR